MHIPVSQSAAVCQGPWQEGPKFQAIQPSRDAQGKQDPDSCRLRIQRFKFPSRYNLVQIGSCVEIANQSFQVTLVQDEYQAVSVLSPIKLTHQAAVHCRSTVFQLVPLCHMREHQVQSSQIQVVAAHRSLIQAMNGRRLAAVQNLNTTEPVH